MRKGCAGQVELALLRQFLAIEPHFVRKGCVGRLELALLRQFLTIEPRFVRKGCAGHLEFAILPQFLAIEPPFVRKGCVSCRLVGTAPAPAFRREIEKKEKARGRGAGGNVPIFQKLWRIRSQANHFSWNNNVVNFSYFATKNWIKKNQSAKVHLSEA